MKKFAILFLTIGLCLQALAATFETPNYAGDWEMDAKRSKLSPMMRVEAMTMKIAQTEKEMKIEINSKTPRGEQSNTVIYDLGGKETTAEAPGGAATYKAKVEKNGNLKLSSTRKVTTQMGEMTITTKDAWELIEDGKTLKVTREIESPRGAISSEMYFTKK